jgi:hypothetical protein
MDHDDFTTRELDLITDVAFNLLESAEFQTGLEFLSIPALRYLLVRCEEVISQQEQIKAAANRRLRELEN